MNDSHHDFKDCRIIHVEDDADDVFIFRRALKRLGFAGFYEQFDSTTAVLARLSHGPAPGIIVADGYRAGAIGVLHLIRHALGNDQIPIIVYSGDVDTHAMDEALRNGATGFLLKKGSFEESLIAVGRILKEWDSRTNRDSAT